MSKYDPACKITDGKVNFAMLNNNNYDLWKFKIQRFLTDNYLETYEEKLLDTVPNLWYSVLVR